MDPKAIGGFVVLVLIGGAGMFVLERNKEFLKSLDPRFLFGLMLLVVIGVLALYIALGQVKQESSFGLESVLGCLATLAGGFAQWAFGKGRKDE
jgi:hypothetical protein